MARRRYDDNFRANAVLMLEAAGYPNTLGALTAVSKKLRVPDRTLSRWFKKQSNPPPDNVVRQKKGEIVEKIDDLLHMILDSIDTDTIDEAPLRERTTAFGILVDKKQLLTGEPTESNSTRILIEYADRQIDTAEAA